MAFGAGNNDSCDTLRRHNLDLSSMFLSLSSDCIHNLDAIVAKAIGRVSELPEVNLAAMTRLFERKLQGVLQLGATIRISLHLTSLLDSIRKG